uniref:PLD phosphodiesterase domain-containing protein n=1 Tax=Paramoeba aestuarina TaxID=180227 RepID=A0A7S4UZ58_9EUKA|mmetsp:Transcript_7942/g.12009  ORF Transcript_7942/g.12009 Transcript_7942/m.12009 type:complete len:537 (+) Transcript_7942:51-1661(+)
MKGAGGRGQEAARAGLKKAQQFVQSFSKDPPKQVLTSDILESLKRRGIPQASVDHWREVLPKLAKYGHLSQGNKISIYASGDQAYSEMWRQIDNANERVWLSTYIFEHDVIGTKFLSKMAEAADRGCAVKLVYDHVGSLSLPPSELSELSKTGAEIIPYNVVTWWFTWRTQFLRNHQKITLIDQNAAFCGGMNIGNEYCSKEVGGNGMFRDTHMKIVGPALEDLEAVYVSSLYEARWHQLRRLSGTSYFRNKRLQVGKVARQYNPFKNFSFPHYVPGKGWEARDIEHVFKVETSPVILARHFFRYLKTFSDLFNPLFFGQPEHFRQPQISLNKSKTPLFETPENRDTGSVVQVLASHTRKQRRIVQQALQLAIKSSRTSCLVTTPYFFPPRKLRQALFSAAKNGSKVRIITAGNSDVKVMLHAARYIYHLFLSHGIEIYEMKSPILHSKTVTIDDVFVTVGSYNFDIFSEKNLEVNVATFDPDAAAALNNQFEVDLTHCKKITLDDLHETSYVERFKQWCCYKVCQAVSFTILARL